MRIASVLFWALIALAPGAHAQDTASQTATFDDMKQGAGLRSPVLPPATPDLTRSLQSELKRVGCLQGAADGVWGDVTRVALADAARRAKLDVATDAPTEGALEILRNRRDRICPLVCGAGQIERNGSCVAKAAPSPKAAKPQAAAEVKRAPRARPENEGRPSMCLRQDGRGQSLVPCSEAPGAQRVY